MKYLGAHLSISKGIYTLQDKMDLLECETCALFLKNQRRHFSKPIEEEKIKLFIENIKTPELLLPHASYLINLANDPQKKGIDNLIDDMKRCSLLGIKHLNLHPGSNIHKEEENIVLKRIADAINYAHKKVEGVTICIENMAGQGNVVGRTFEEISKIIENIKDKTRIGVVIDTCHVFCGGYDIRTANSFEKVMIDFKKIIGLKYLKGMHLNDSKMDFDSRKDRHEQLGKGKIGMEAFKFIMNSDDFNNIPLILETPEPEKYFDEIKLLRSLIEK